MAFRLRYLRTYATLLALTSLAACSSKHDPKPVADPMGMSWTVDGNNVTATQTDKTVTTSDLKLDGGAGSASGGSAISLMIPKKAGTYDLASSTNDASAVYAVTSSTNGTGYLATTGTITVTALTATNVTGTFTFTGADISGSTTTTKTITNGKFNIAL